MKKSKHCHILHISNLHICEKENFDRSVVLDPLIDRVGSDREAGHNPEVVVVSGDLAATGALTEYENAKLFFNDLLCTLELSEKNLFLKELLSYRVKSKKAKFYQESVFLFNE